MDYYSPDLYIYNKNKKYLFQDFNRPFISFKSTEYLIVLKILKRLNVVMWNININVNKMNSYVEENNNKFQLSIYEICVIAAYFDMVSGKQYLSKIKKSVI